MAALGNRVLPSSWAVRAIGDPAGLARAVQQEVLRVDPDLPVARVMTMDRIIGKSIARQNFNMILLGVFGGCRAAAGGHRNLRRHVLYRAAAHP